MSHGTRRGSRGNVCSVVLMTDQATIVDHGESHTQSGDNKEVNKGGY